MEYTVINYLFDKGETVSEGICFTSKSKVTGLSTIISPRANAPGLIGLMGFWVDTSGDNQSPNATISNYQHH